MDHSFDALMRRQLAAIRPRTDYTIDCFVSSEVGYNEVIAQCLPTEHAGGGAYLGVGPDQSYTYVGALRSELAIIVDARIDNLLEHLVFKALFVEARDPLDYLCLLLGRERPSTTLNEDLAGPHLIDRLQLAPLEPATQAEARALVRALLVDRLGAANHLADAGDRILDEFVRRQLDITSVSESCLANLDKIPTFEEVICATTPEGFNLHYLTSRARFAHVKWLHANDRVVPILGNVVSRETVAHIGELLAQHELALSTIYLSNLEEFLLRRYVIKGDRIVARPNPEGLLVGEEGRAYQQLVDNLRALPCRDDAMLIRFFFPGEYRGRKLGVFPWLQSHVAFVDDFLGRFAHDAPRSVFATYL